MADSRIAAQRLVRYMKPRLLSKTGLFLMSALLAYILAYHLSPSDLTVIQRQTVFILFFAVGLWITEAIPPFAVSILIIAFLVFTQGYLAAEQDKTDISKYTNTWSSSVIWLMLGGFFLAKGMEKTGLDTSLFRLTLHVFGKKQKKLLLGLMLTTAIGSMLMSNTAVTAMMIASLMPMLSGREQQQPMVQATLLGIPAAASLGGMGTIIGSPPNAIAVGTLAAVGIEISFLEWMLAGFPLAILFTLLVWWLLARHQKITNQISINADNLTQKEHKVPRREQLWVRFTIILTLGLWLTSEWHGIPVAGVSGIPIALLTLAGIIDGNDVRSLPWDTLMLVAGGLALGIALVDTRLADIVIGDIEGFLGAMGLYGLIFIMALLTAVLSNIMSNTATSSILVPVAILLVPNNQIAMALAIGLCASTALLLPISTPPNAIAYSTGMISQKDFRYIGLRMLVLGPVIIVLWAALIKGLVS